MTKHAHLPIFLALALLGLENAAAQELEPRRWSHLPVGANFIGAAYVYGDYDIFFDPALEIEDAAGEVHTLALSYVRVLNVFGKSGRVDITLPYSIGRWEGLLQGQPASTRRSGFNDPRMRFAVNLYGSPALSGQAFRQYRTNTVVGAALEITAPLGEYQRDRLITLGKNRWVFRPQLGATHSWGKWTAELTGSLWFYTDNDEFNGSQTREQDTLYTLQSHLIHTFRPGLWASVSAGYGNGAQSTIDGVERNDKVDKLLLAASVGLPLTALQGVKITYIKGSTENGVGDDYDRLLLAYSAMWGGN